MKSWGILVVLFLITTCKINSINYALDEVRIISKVKTTLEEQPAIELTLKNEGESEVFDILVTAKAKRNQEDIDQAVGQVAKIGPDQTITLQLIFNEISSHKDYDFLTYAVNYVK
ncbi:hypothetical protein MJD09_13505 [bacterium]|nr:hypothetical protein [bacterium]